MSQPRPSFLIRSLVFLLVCGAVALGGRWFLHSQEQAGTAPQNTAPKGAVSVTVAKVDKQNFATDIDAIGTVFADESADIKPNVTEVVTALKFDDGQSVKKGDLLATLNDAEEQAMLGTARSALAEEEREVTRLAALVKEGAAPEAKLQERQTLAEQAKQKIRETEARIADRKIIAPFDGVLGLRRISVGALVSPTTVIVTLDKINTVKIDFAVPETAMPSLKLGAEIRAHAAAARDRMFSGKLAHFDSRVDPITRSVAARAEVPNPSHELKPGMLVMVRLAMDPGLSLAIPERALVPIGSKAFIFTLAGDKARRVEIKTGRRKPGTIEVTGGLKEGQTVIADGLVGLQDGMSVHVTGSYAGPVQPFDPEQPK